MRRHLILVVRFKSVNFRKLLKSLLILGSLVFVVGFSFLHYQTHPRLWPVFKDAQNTVAAIESYRSSHHKLPNSIAEVAPQFNSEAGPVYYEQGPENGQYVVYFGTSLGESFVYDSSTGKWQ